MILPTPLLSLLSVAFHYSPALYVPIESSAASQYVDPRVPPFTNERVLASNKASIPSTPHRYSFCFRPIISGLPPSSYAPVIEAIRTLTLSTDEPGAPFSKQKTWAATTKSGPIYQWGVPGNPCKIKVMVDPALGPAVEVTDTFSKADVERAAKDIMADCVDSDSQAGRRAVGRKKGIFVTLGGLGKTRRYRGLEEKRVMAAAHRLVYRMFDPERESRPQPNGRLKI
ncbi:MAG: hypothetical protein LQ343_000977 [Gyalolechia ehrenbergii]|nr:MAG: hypothetical protein LQ343_000977 [Gyalolechia ehrenbergii]